MAKIKNPSFFLKINFNLQIICSLLLISISSPFVYANAYNQTPRTSFKQKRELANEKKVFLIKTQNIQRDNLLKADFIYKRNVTGLKGGMVTVYEATPESETVVNIVFREECNKPIQTYDHFHYERKRFIHSMKSKQNYNVILIEKPIKKCTKHIYNKLALLSHDFVKPLLEKYDSINPNQFSKNMRVTLTGLSFASDVTSLSKGPDHLEKIKKAIEEYIEFEEKCSDPMTILNCNDSSVENDDYSCYDSRYYPNIKTNFESWKEGFRGKSCNQWYTEFQTFTKSDSFQSFISLPDKCQKPSDCVEDITNKLKENHQHQDNLFNKCKTERDRAYNTCFGEEGRRKELQLALYLLDQKSSSLCEGSQLAQAEQAKQNCLHAVNQCVSECEGAIDDFKKDFMQCFYLPDFESYDQLHKNNKCKGTINKLNKQFEGQAKQEPFRIDKKNKALLKSLDHPNNSNSSPAYHIIGACNDILKDRQIDKKLAEMQRVCQQKPNNQQQQQNQLINPVTSASLPSGSQGNRNPASSSSNGSGQGVGSQSFSYGSNNSGFKFNNNNLQGEEEGYQSSKPYQASFSDSHRPNSLNKSDSKSISAEFEDTDDSSKDSNPYSRPDSAALSRRGAGSYGGSSVGSEELSSEITNETTGKSEGLKDKINKSVRSFLSSDEQYGAIDESSYPQSGTQSFLEWVSNQNKKAKKAVLNAYDKMVGISPAEFKRRLSLNDEHVNLFELQKEMFVMACQTYNCGSVQASPPEQTQRDLSSQ